MRLTKYDGEPYTQVVYKIEIDASDMDDARLAGVDHHLLRILGRDDARLSELLFGLSTVCAAIEAIAPVLSLVDGETELDELAAGSDAAETREDEAGARDPQS